MNGTDFERLSQENKLNQAPVDSILEKAESIAQGVLESIQKIAGATACKRVQITRLTEMPLRDLTMTRRKTVSVLWTPWEEPTM